MSDGATPRRIELAPEQKAERRRIREMHRLSPVREVPVDTIMNGDVWHMIDFVRTIRREREAQGLTLNQLAELACVDLEVLTRLEAAHSFNPTVSILFRLARALGKRLIFRLDDEEADTSR